MLRILSVSWTVFCNSVYLNIFSPPVAPQQIDCEGFYDTLHLPGTHKSTLHEVRLTSSPLSKLESCLQETSEGLLETTLHAGCCEDFSLDDTRTQ